MFCGSSARSIHGRNSVYTAMIDVEVNVSLTWSEVSVSASFSKTLLTYDKIMMSLVESSVWE